MTVYAITKKSSRGGSNTSYTVSFDTRGGSAADNVSVNGNALLSKPQDPTREGYTFAGWFTDAACTQPYDFNRKVTGNLTLYAKWIEGTSQTEGWKNPFTDVAEGDWFYRHVAYAVNNKLFSGTSDTTFEPDGLLTRAMLVTVLWRAEGKPQVNYIMPFHDVQASSYYAEAVRWAASEGIVKGHSETAFGSEDNITREQIAAIIHRYARYKGYDVSVGENTNILSYDDVESVSEYAVASVQYAVGAGLMKGKTDTTINPQDNATRAEIAAILQRFLEANKF